MSDTRIKPKHDAPVKAQFYAPKVKRCWLFHQWKWRPAEGRNQFADCARCGMTKYRFMM